MRFGWDAAKARENLAKHGVTFDEAATIFFDPLAKLFYDEDHSDVEDRFFLVGESVKRRILIVFHTYREVDEDLIWIISARRANAAERKVYEEH